MRVPIVEFGMGWNTATNAGKITIKLVDGQTVKLVVETAAEFTAIATVLNESPVYWNTEEKSISTDWEDVGGS